MADETITLKVHEELTLPNIQEATDTIKDALEGIKEGTKCIEIDAEHVDEVDSAGIQLLVALITHLKALSIEIEWLAPSVAILSKSIAISAYDLLEVE